MAKRDTVMTDQERAESFVYERVRCESPPSFPPEFERLEPGQRAVFRYTAQRQIELVLAGIRIGRSLATAGGLPGKAKAGGRLGKAKGKKTEEDNGPKGTVG